MLGFDGIGTKKTRMTSISSKSVIRNNKKNKCKTENKETIQARNIKVVKCIK